MTEIFKVMVLFLVVAYMVLIGYDQEYHHYFKDFCQYGGLNFLTMLVPLMENFLSPLISINSHCTLIDQVLIYSPRYLA